MSGINCGERKGKKIQDWAEKEMKLVCKRDSPSQAGDGGSGGDIDLGIAGSPLLCGRKWNAQGRAAHSLSAAEDVISSADMRTLY